MNSNYPEVVEPKTNILRKKRQVMIKKKSFGSRHTRFKSNRCFTIYYVLVGNSHIPPLLTYQENGNNNRTHMSGEDCII